MKNRRITGLKLCIALLCALSALLTARFIIGLEGGITRHQQVTNILLSAILISNIGGGILKEIGTWGVSDARKKGENMPQEGVKNYTSLKHEAMTFEEWEKSQSEKTPPDMPEKREDKSEAQASERDYTAQAKGVRHMLGYAEITNRQELMFNAVPTLQIVNHKSTYSIYKVGEGYYLEPSEHWYNKRLSGMEIRNEHFKALFNIEGDPGANECLLRQTRAAAELAPNDDGWGFVLKQKGVLNLETPYL